MPDIDLRTNRQGLWNDLEALPADARKAAFDNYITAVAGIVSERANSKLYLLFVRQLASSRTRRGDRANSEPDRRALRQ